MKPCIFPLYLVAACLLLPAAGASPIADVHIHYKWSQADVTSPDEALATLEQHDVALAVVIGTPAHLALTLSARAPARLVPVWSPYRASGDWATWTRDAGVLERARSAIQSGQYQGIGELHLIGGFAPAWDSAVIEGLFRLAAEYDLPVLLHTEFSRPDYLLRLCSAHPDTRVLWAHAGAILRADQVDKVMKSCAKVWVDFSARDPWRFVNNPVTTPEGKLLPEWHSFVERWQDRIMIGSDPVWPVDQMDRWDEADTGWQQYARFIDFHRRWLSLIDPVIAKKIRIGNAQEFFQRR